MSAGTFFKTFSNSDKTTTRTLLHESIPITGTLVSGTYAVSSNRNVNTKTYSHGMFQSQYDYPFLSSSANHLFDVTVGVSSVTGAGAGLDSLSGSITNQRSKKVNVYSQMAQVLAGYDTSGNVRSFDADGDYSSAGGHENAIFINFSRLLVKDEIKKGSFSMVISQEFALENPVAAAASLRTITDAGSATSYKVNSPAGEYGILKSGSANVGLIYYQAGVAVLTSSIFIPEAPGVDPQISTAGGMQATLTASTIDTACDGIRSRISNISFNNTTELNSSIYFCRANHNEFNYSSNPTYLDGSSIRVKGNDRLAPPRSYVTTVGLYSADNELLAVAKLSEPLRKDPTNELTLRVRLDY